MYDGVHKESDIGAKSDVIDRIQRIIDPNIAIMNLGLRDKSCLHISAAKKIYRIGNETKSSGCHFISAAFTRQIFH